MVRKAIAFILVITTIFFTLILFEQSTKVSAIEDDAISQMAEEIRDAEKKIEKIQNKYNDKIGFWQSLSRIFPFVSSFCDKMIEKNAKKMTTEIAKAKKVIAYNSAYAEVVVY